jgi:hypothetical protein
MVMFTRFAFSRIVAGEQRQARSSVDAAALLSLLAVLGVDGSEAPSCFCGPLLLYS